VTVKRISFWE